jgi:hypothetical protein
LPTQKGRIGLPTSRNTIFRFSILYQKTFKCEIHKTIASLGHFTRNFKEPTNTIKVVTYISMGFGNPYGDPWNTEIVGQWTETL